MCPVCPWVLSWRRVGVKCGCASLPATEAGSELQRAAMDRKDVRLPQGAYRLGLGSE